MPRHTSNHIADICNRHVVSVRRDCPIADCAKLMHDRHVGALVVVEESLLHKHPVGVITDRDLAIEVLAFGVDAKLICAEDVMLEPLATVSRTAGIGEAIAIMREHGVRRLPVVDEQGSLCGIVSADDLWTTLSGQIETLVGVIRKSEARERQSRASRAV